MNPNLSLLNNNRRHNGYFNNAMHDNPHPPRRSKAAPISVKNSSRTAALYALLLAGQYAAQTVQAINSRPGKIGEAINSRSNRTERSNDNAEGEFDSRARERADLGKQKSNFNESHASGIRPTSSAAPVDLCENIHRNSSFPPNLRDAIHVPTSAVSADSRPANNSRSDPSAPNVLGAQPHKRSIDEKKDPLIDAIEITQTAEAAKVTEATASDIQTEDHPLIAARKQAARNLLGEAAGNLTDEHLLLFANKVHLDSEENHTNGLGNDDDLALWKEEAKIWCAQNGGDKFPVSEEKCLEIFKEAWDLALDPPQPPIGFKDWHQVRKEVVESMTLSEQMAIMLSPNGPSGERAHINARATTQYYEQFVRYIEEHLDRFVVAKTIANAAAAGLSRLELETPLLQARVIKGVKLGTLNEWTKVARLTRPSDSDLPAAIIFEIGGSSRENRFGFIGQNGNLKFFKREDLWWIGERNGETKIRLHDAKLLLAMGFDSASHDNPSPLECKVSNLSLCPITSFSIDHGEDGLGYLAFYDGKSIKDVMEAQVRESVEYFINAFKAGNDGKSIFDRVLGSIIPFYDQIIGVINDPGHKINFGDIAFDLIDLGITLASIGGAGFKALRSGFAAARAAIAAGEGTLAALRALKGSIGLSRFLKKAGIEFIDFVTPPFTAPTVRRMVHRAHFPSEGLSQKIKSLNWDEMLRCKRGLFDNCIPRLWARPAGEALEALDDIERLNIFYKKADATFKNPAMSESRLKEYINIRADRELPNVLYRGQPRPGAAPAGGSPAYSEVGFAGPAHATYDDVLAYAIKHTGSEKGIKDKAASLSGSQKVSQDFVTRHADRNYALFQINRRPGVMEFRRIENIIKYDGARLVREGKVTEEEFIDALHHVFVTEEDEIFYVANFGKIPRDLVSEVEVPPRG
ncbi:hypothetical protein [Pandoraea pulmonicola]|uniref:Uncharacterized protein n=1 Tax=Pandoraea pulmonicola TaxID=93221 RepID=A0AAJ5CYH8_PANPU|nr:hypothetical protein [Pandoraea pulmonicola]SUA88579.1 Uncharacterised protein [Pandoraea pulmonicola]